VTQRLRSDILASALLARARAQAAFGVVAQRGHEEGGIIHIILRGAEGSTLLTETTDPDGQLAWRIRLEAATDGEVEAKMAREQAFDPDLWLLEFEGGFATGHLPGRVLPAAG
jgi:hypothetical protein